MPNEAAHKSTFEGCQKIKTKNEETEEEEKNHERVHQVYKCHSFRQNRVVRPVAKPGDAPLVEHDLHSLPAAALDGARLDARADVGDHHELL